MKVLAVNKSVATGGAAVAALRLVQALRSRHMDARLLAADARPADAPFLVAPPAPRVAYKLNFLWERALIWAELRFRRRHLFDVDVAVAGRDITHLAAFRRADVVHLHWVNQGFLSLRNLRAILRTGKPVVWTLHDMWPFTGVCHHRHECRRLDQGCGRCPLLPGCRTGDLSRRVFARKARLLSARWPNLHFVAVSTWLKACAAESPLLAGYPISVIGNAISLDGFAMLPREESRRRLGLPSGRIIAFGAARVDAPIKGFGLLKEALAKLVARTDFNAADLLLVTYGGVHNPHVFDGLPVPHVHLGYLRQEQLPQVFSAATVTVSSSYYETFAQTLVEAQACGCLPVAFEGSGPDDIIVHRHNGYLARHLDTADLARGIAWALDAHQDREALRRDVAERFDERVIARRYEALYAQMQAQAAPTPLPHEH